jgi:hypothetical protein
MKAALRRLVWQRAGNRCEYCLMHQDHDALPHHVDHIIAQKHHGLTAESNLALACANCSLGKGSNIAAIDRTSKQLTRLFHPRTDRWTEHFRWSGAKLRGRSSVGRVTIAVLNINQPDRVAIRSWLILAGEFPPPAIREASS